MLDNNYHNSSCAFAEQVVSYLYGEENALEKTAFEAHLSSCSSCAEELAGFEFVRSSIIEWKRADFFNLETPSIEIPYRAAVSTEKQSPFSGIRRFFAFSPAFSIASAAIIVCVGLGLLALNFSTTGEVAKDNNKPAESVVSPVSEKQVEQPVKETVERIAVQPAANERLKPSESVARIASKNQIVTASNNPTKNRIVTPNPKNVTKIREIKDNKDALAVQKQSIPKLNNIEEEEEDNSLRLADLFAENEGG